jgi:hypothetical protein
MALVGAMNVACSGDSDPKSWSGNCCLQLAHATSAKDVREFEEQCHDFFMCMEGKKMSQVAAALEVAVVEDFPQNFLDMSKF